MVTSEVSVQINDAAFDQKTSAVRHCVLGVDCQVHDDLLYLADIRLYGGKLGAQSHIYLNIFP
jgi:hypothetical protein